MNNTPLTDLPKQTSLYLYRGASKKINVDFRNFVFAGGSKCVLSVSDICRKNIVKTFEFTQSKEYNIEFTDEFTASLLDNKYIYNIMYIVGEERYPQCADSDIYVSEVINKYDTGNNN